MLVIARLHETAVSSTAAIEMQLGIVPTGALLTPPAHNEYDEEAYGRLHGVHEAATTAEQRMRLDRLFDL